MTKYIFILLLLSLVDAKVYTFNEKFNALIKYQVDKKIAVVKTITPHVQVIQDEFENNNTFKKRVEAVKQYFKKKEEDYLKQREKIITANIDFSIQNSLRILYGKPIVKLNAYHSDAQYYDAILNFNKKTINQKIKLHINKDSAEIFKNNIDKYKVRANFTNKNGKLTFNDIDFTYNNKTYKAMLNYAYPKYINDIFYNVKFLNNSITTKIDVIAFDEKNYMKYFTYDYLDNYISSLPQNEKILSKEYLFLIGIGKYQYRFKNEYALRSTKALKKLSALVLNTPSTNLASLYDDEATIKNIKKKYKKFVALMAKNSNITIYINAKIRADSTFIKDDEKPYKKSKGFEILAYDFDPKNKKHIRSDDYKIYISELINSLEGNNILKKRVIVDGCVDDTILDNISNKNNLEIYSSCQIGEKRLVNKLQGYSLFTYHYIKALGSLKSTNSIKTIDTLLKESMKEDLIILYGNKEKQSIKIY